jgi:hypothetical protein
MLRKWNLEIVTHIQNELSTWWGVIFLTAIDKEIINHVAGS